MSEIDDLMHLDPLSLSGPFDERITKIIEYQRQQRQNHEMGIKPKKEAGQKISLDSVYAALSPKSMQPPTISKRRF